MQNQNIDEITLKAIDEYSNKIATNEIIEECDFTFNIETIKSYIQDYIATTNERPTIIIDYLQILAPSNPKFTDKQQVDYNITSLKKLSRDFKIPIIAISSFNRMNYTQTASFEAFKESGGIEYTADVLLTMQLKILSDEKTHTNDEIREAKKKLPREVQLVCLKNRNGKSNFTINYDFNPVFNSFKEQPKGLQEL
jgi:replicative DNA helicase